MRVETRAGVTFEIAETEDEFRGRYPPTSEIARRKAIPRLDAHCRAFIARSPFVCLATASVEGPLDVSPRGDAPGFVHVLDETTLFLPDRLGNNRLDSLSNLVRQPELALIFLIPGVDETLRVNGRGRIVLASPLLGASAVNGKTPTTGILIEVQEAFLQCAKALRRSQLWGDTYRISRTQLATLGQMLVDQTGMDTTAEQLDCLIDQAYREKMY